MKKALHASIRQAMLSRGFLTGIIGTACISPLYGSTPVRGPCVSVRRSCDADAFGRTGPTRARPQVWRGSSRRVLACFTAARRARVAHVPRVSRTSGTVTRCHGRRLLAKGVVLRAAMSEGGAKKKAGTICEDTKDAGKQRFNIWKGNPHHACGAQGAYGIVRAPKDAG